MEQIIFTIQAVLSLYSICIFTGIVSNSEDVRLIVHSVFCGSLHTSPLSADLLSGFHGLVCRAAMSQIVKWAVDNGIVNGGATPSSTPRPTFPARRCPFHFVTMLDGYSSIHLDISLDLAELDLSE